MENEYKNDIRIFKALSDEKRLMILQLLRSGEKCACVLSEELKIGQSALSYHMKILCESNLVKARQDGKWTHYALDTNGSMFAMKCFLHLTTPQIEEEKNCCRKESF